MHILISQIWDVNGYFWDFKFENSELTAVNSIAINDYSDLQVSDLGEPRLSSELATKVQITVTNVNDCAPVFLQSEYNVTLLLPTYKNVVVIQVNATDRDGTSENNTLRYEFTEDSGADGTFSINSVTGVITTR